MHAATGLDLQSVGPGFGDPVADAQQVFRCILDAMARPGRVAELPPGILPAQESGLSDAAAAVALTLLDFETPVWLGAARRSAASFLRFQCGAPVIAEPESARFGLAADVAELPALSAFDLGSEDFPDRSTTLILDVSALAAGDGIVVRGPGIEDRAWLRIAGLGAEFWRARAELEPLFPLGLDLVFTCGRLLAAMPRTTVVEI
jgi:alpha-D-ribose 1-methylphosphonate 5-triphosphate synthase subunit PhnH